MPHHDLMLDDLTWLLDVMAGPHGRPPTPDRPVDLLVVFGCADPRLGQDAAALFRQGVTRHVLFTGGIGKDSGGLASLGIAEADFLASIAIGVGLPTESTLIERFARNGAENAALSLRLAIAEGVLKPGGTVASCAPAQRSRRLYEELRYQADATSHGVEVVAGLSTGRSSADVRDPVIGEELLREARGLHTMHAATPPRILPQADFQAGGPVYERFRTQLCGPTR